MSDPTHDDDDRDDAAPGSGSEEHGEPTHPGVPVPEEVLDADDAGLVEEEPGAAAVEDVTGAIPEEVLDDLAAADAAAAAAAAERARKGEGGGEGGGESGSGSDGGAAGGAMPGGGGAAGAGGGAGAAAGAEEGAAAVVVAAVTEVTAVTAIADIIDAATGAEADHSDGVARSTNESATATAGAPPVEAEAGAEAQGEFDPATDPGITDVPPAPPAPDEPAAEGPPSAERLESIVESLVFAADRPLRTDEIAGLVGEPELGRVEAALAALGERYAGRGIQLHLVGGGWQLRTDAVNAAWVSRLVAGKPVRLSRALLETLAIVAYRQPITRPEMDDIRGVDCGGTLKTLLDRSLVRILGKKEEPGRPLLYGTTKDFLEFFHLGDLKELPTLREFHELSGEHQAEVAALAAAAPEGALGADDREALRGLVAPLGSVDLGAGLDAQLGDVDQKIEAAARRAEEVGRRLQTEAAPTPGGEPPAAG